MERSTRDPDRRTEAAVEESRRGLYVGAGLCLGSAFGYLAASVVGSRAAMALFGAAVPLLLCQVGLEYRLLRRLRRQQPVEGAAVGPVRLTALAEHRIDRLRGDR